MLIFLVGVACFRSESANGIIAKVSPLRRPAFFEAKKRRQKTPFRCEPDSGPKSLYAALYCPTGLSVTQTRSGYVSPRWTGSKVRYQLFVVV